MQKLRPMPLAEAVRDRLKTRFPKNTLRSVTVKADPRGTPNWEAGPVNFDGRISPDELAEFLGRIQEHYEMDLSGRLPHAATAVG